MTLPTLQITYSCGSCGNELEHDGENLYCHPCRLEYTGDPADQPEADFIEEVNPCGHPGHLPVTRRHPFQTINGTIEQWKTTTTTHEACSLPSDHDGFHYHYPRMVHTFDDGRQPVHPPN